MEGSGVVTCVWFHDEVYHWEGCGPFQRLLGSSLDPKLQYFGRSLASSKDLNDDTIPDISVGAYGKVVQLWWVWQSRYTGRTFLTRRWSIFYLTVVRSRGVATISATGSFNPDKINIFDKACDINGRKYSCFNTRLCFSATFRPNNPVGPIGKRTIPLRRMFLDRQD